MKSRIILFVLILPLNILRSQVGFDSYHSRSDFLLTSPGAMGFGLYGYDNPAILTYVDNPNLLLTWTAPNNNWFKFDRWGLFAAIPNFGFGVISQKIGNSSVNDYRISSAFGDKSFGLGISYGWSGGDTKFFHRSNLISTGILFRPSKLISFGLIGTTTTDFHNKEGVLDFAFRPFGNETIALFADYVVRKNISLTKGPWSVGAALEPLPGIRITARYFDTKFLNVGFQLSLGNIGFTSQSHFDPDQKYLNNSYGIRFGAYDRNVLTKLFPEENYLKIELTGPIKYQKFILFDKSNTLINILFQIDAAKNDREVKGIVINASNIIANREMLWEIRSKLAEFKSSGKKVIIFIDRANIDLYHFASVADKIVMDEIGLLTLEGYMMGRNFYKGTLEKLGIGYDEWRFFKYKSAMESFSREKMSDADREQRQKLVDANYELAKKEIRTARNLSSEKFDELVDNQVVFASNEALKKGLVDTLARWDAVEDLLKKYENDETKLIGMNSLERIKLPSDNYWGEKPRIAVVYAIGACAMDEGITARKLIKDIEEVVQDNRVKAIVLRVDSPGGDAMASDYIAEAIKKAKGKKPVIISQGYVAASGGYWLSMYGDTIVAAPNTITGSIGVIGGWFYNKELKEKLGVTTDLVQRGKHADIGYGILIPLINMSLPDRNLNDEERTQVEKLIKGWYESFVERVASGRNKNSTDIQEIAQGRVWSGTDGLSIGLVDSLGGLETAINIARDKAQLKDSEFEIIQYPKMPLIDFSSLMPSPFSELIKQNTSLEVLKFRMKNNGKPLLMAPLDEFIEETIER